MNVLVFNVGSASLKFQVIATAPDMVIPEQGRALVSGAVKEFGAEATLSLFENREIAHQEKGAPPRLRRSRATGAALAACDETARPAGDRIHNAPAVSVIRASQEALGSDLPMVAVFDTEFHRSIPPEAYT